MPYSFEWYIEDQVLYERLTGDVTLEDLSSANEKVSLMVGNCSNPPLHLIIDLSAIEHHPINLREIAGTLRSNNRAKLGWTIIITQNRFIRYIASITSQLAGARFRIFDEPEAGISFLRSMDDRLEKVVPDESAK